MLNSKITVAATILISGMFSMNAHAVDQYSDRGRVLSVKPQTERVNIPRQTCHTEYRQERITPRRGVISGGTVLGGIAGGLLGSTIGKGSGRVAAAAVGAGLGAIAGDRMSNRNRDYARARRVPVESCYEVDDWKTINTGYLVDYEYNGRQYTTVTDQRPGKYIDLNVTVAPISNGAVRSGGYIQSSNEYFLDDTEYPRDNRRGRRYMY